jgi:hypothetical protein
MGRLNEYNFSEDKQNCDQNEHQVLDIVSTNNVFVASYKCGTVKVFEKSLISYFKGKRYVC